MKYCLLCNHKKPDPTATQHISLFLNNNEYKSILKKKTQWINNKCKISNDIVFAVNWSEQIMHEIQSNKIMKKWLIFFISRHLFYSSNDFSQNWKILPKKKHLNRFVSSGRVGADMYIQFSPKNLSLQFKSSNFQMLSN